MKIAESAPKDFIDRLYQIIHDIYSTNDYRYFGFHRNHSNHSHFLTAFVLYSIQYYNIILTFSSLRKTQKWETRSSWCKISRTG